MQQLIKSLLEHKKLLFIAAICYTATLLYLSLGNISNIPRPKFQLADKVWHCIAYFGLASLWGLAFFAVKKYTLTKTIITICIAAIVFGIIVEFLQGSLTSYRTFDFFDALANTLGVIVAVPILLFINHKYRDKI